MKSMFLNKLYIANLQTLPNDFKNVDSTLLENKGIKLIVKKIANNEKYVREYITGKLIPVLNITDIYGVNDSLDPERYIVLPDKQTCVILNEAKCKFGVIDYTLKSNLVKASKDDVENYIRIHPVISEWDKELDYLLDNVSLKQTR